MFGSVTAAFLASAAILVVSSSFSATAANPVQRALVQLAPIASPVHVEVDAAENTLSPHVAEHTWNCSIKAWVRAPDLRPNMLASGDARLVLNGSDCVDVVKWDVGLRFKERSIVRLAAPNVELPKKPTYNETAERLFWDSRTESHPHDGILSFDRYPEMGYEQSPYQQANRAYSQQLSNRSLWEVHGAERVVFDTRVELASVTGDIKLPAAGVQTFGLAVPAVNLPPFEYDHGPFFMDDDTPEFSSAEKWLGYYFVLTLMNGTTVEVPAGRTTFLPEPTPVPAAAVGMTTARLELERSSWNSRDGLPTDSCVVDNSTHFEVDVEFPETTVFAQGQQQDLVVTVRRIGGSKLEVPFYITVKPNTNISKTWASSFAHSNEQRDRLSGKSTMGHPWRIFPGQYTKQLYSRPAATREERRKEQEKQEKRASGAVEMCSFSHGIDGDDGDATRTELQNLDEQTVTVNFTVPTDFLPSSSGTFVDFISSLRVNLHTTYACERASDESAVLDDVNDDEAWQGHFSWRDEVKMSGVARNVLVADTPITILPTKRLAHAASQEGAPILHYLNHGAKAPRLLVLQDLPASLLEVAFDNVLHTVVEEATDDELREHRYEDYRRFIDDGAWEQTGRIWAMKVRRELDALEDAELLAARGEASPVDSPMFLHQGHQ